MLSIESTRDGLSLGGTPGVLGCTPPAQGAAHTEYNRVLGLSLGKEPEQAKRDQKASCLSKKGRGREAHSIPRLCLSALACGLITFCPADMMQLLKTLKRP